MAREKMSTEERLEIVERKLSSVRRWAVVSLVVAVVIVIIGGLLEFWLYESSPTYQARRQRPRRYSPVQSAAGKEIRAYKFVVEDKNGKTRASLAMCGGEPMLSLFDENGKRRASLDLLEGDAHLEFCDENNLPRARFELWTGKPRLSLSDEDGRTYALSPWGGSSFKGD